jgi:hypothetical protein
MTVVEIEAGEQERVIIPVLAVVEPVPHRFALGRADRSEKRPSSCESGSQNLRQLSDAERRRRPVFGTLSSATSRRLLMHVPGVSGGGRRGWMVSTVTG